MNGGLIKTHSIYLYGTSHFEMNGGQISAYYDGDYLMDTSTMVMYGGKISNGDCAISNVSTGSKTTTYDDVEYTATVLILGAEELSGGFSALTSSKGKVIINKEGFNYIGTKNNEEFNFHLNPSEVPTYGMCTDVSRFYTFYKGEFYEFYPNIDLVEKVFLVTEEIHRLNGGKWQDFKFEVNKK